MTAQPKACRLGLVGGLGIGATSHYYKQLALRHAAVGDVPELIIIHADVDRVLADAAAGRISQLAVYLAEFLNRLHRAGAQVAAFPSVTPHICIAELTALSPIPLIGLPEAILAGIHARHLNRVAIFGTRMTIESALFGQLPGMEVVSLASSDIDTIHAAYLRTVHAGHGCEADRIALSSVAHKLCQHDKVDAIVFAGTELSLLFHPGNTDFPHVDGAALHLDAIMRKILPGSF